MEPGDGVMVADVEAIGRRVVELLRGERIVASAGGTEFIDAAELARRFGTRRSWIYAHAVELGAIRLGTGPRSRLRFDPIVATERLRLVAQGSEGAPVARRRRRSAERRRDAHLLPIKGGGAN